MKGNIINVTRFCTDDGPGIRTTVFLKGCPLKCLWCHNPESQKFDIETYTNGEVIGRNALAEEIVKEVTKDKVFYENSGGGVTVSGGEPLAQPEFTTQILKDCKENGIHTAIETSGYASETAFKKVLEYCDLVLFDIKETNEKNHLIYTGVPLNTVINNLKTVNENKVPFIIRLPIIPNYNDRQEHFSAVKNFPMNLNFARAYKLCRIIN